MRIPSEPFDRECQDKALVEALTSPNSTAVYLDTSALVWLYRIRERARSEFVAFFGGEPLSPHVHIPFWSLHELSKQRTSPKALFPLLDQHAKLTNAIDQIRSNARLFVDDRFASGTSWSTAEQYLGALNAACDSLLKVTKPLNKAGELRAIDASLAPFLADHALARPLPELASLRTEFLARCEGRLPPGFEDRGKGGNRPDDDFAGANRFGDYVFWRSLLEHAASKEDIRTVVIISHDAKRDWVHVPEHYVGYGEAPKRNDTKGSARVTCPHPALSFEIGVEASVTELLIVSITQLVSAFSLNGAGAAFKELARAIQIEDVGQTTSSPNSSDGDDAAPLGLGDQEPTEPPPASAPDGEGAAVDEGPEPRTGDAGPVAGLSARLDALPASALADADYAGDPGGNPEADAIIADLKVRNWYVQNPAVMKLDEVVDDPATSDAQLFVLGRNLYQAACGNAFRASDRLRTLLRLGNGVRDDALPILFAGALFEVYFDGSGHLRELPKSDQLEPLFVLARRPEFKEVVAWLYKILAPVLPAFPLVPGDARDSLTVDVVFDAAGLPTGVAIDGVVISEPALPFEDVNWDPDGLAERVLPDRLADVIARHFHVPEERVQVAPRWEEPRDFSSLRLRAWTATGDLVFPPDQPLAQD